MSVLKLAESLNYDNIAPYFFTRVIEILFSLITQIL